MHTEQSRDTQAPKPELIELAVSSVLSPRSSPQSWGTGSPLWRQGPGVAELLRFLRPGQYLAEASSAALSCLTHPTCPTGPAGRVGEAQTVHEAWDVSVGQTGLHLGLWEAKRSLLTRTRLALLSLWLFLQPHPKSFEAGASLGLEDN